MPRRDLNRDFRVLTRVARARIITLYEASLALDLTRRRTTLRLAALTRRGWLRRIRRGVFLVIPPTAISPRLERVHDSHVLAESLFGPCYIGGWSAASHWGIECARRHAIFVVTAAHVRRAMVCAEGFRFHLVHGPKEVIAGPDIRTGEWWGAPVSGPARTIVDALADPRRLGGAVYLADALVTMSQSENWDEDRFLDIVRAVARGAANKRLGALIDAKGIVAHDLWRHASSNRTLGVIDLEPGTGRRGWIDRYWRVHMNAKLDGSDLPEDDGVEEDFLEGIDELDP
jgi:predicted transcriptional regulator of viral defense system